MIHLRDGDLFEVNEDHLKLLQRAYVSWEHCEYGAPAIDCKRPYGNSDPWNDIGRILDWDIPDEETLSAEDFDREHEALQERARAIHEEMEVVLQIIFFTLTIEPGRYRKVGTYGREWERV